LITQSNLQYKSIRRKKKKKGNSKT